MAAFVAAGLAGASCADRIPVAPQGRWGGHNIQLVVTVGGASVLLKCGSAADFREPLFLDASSAFDVSGTYTTPAIPRAQPARLTGSVTGQSMTAVISVAGEPLDTFQLVFGEHGAFDTCSPGGQG